MALRRSVNPNSSMKAGEHNTGGALAKTPGGPRGMVRPTTGQSPKTGAKPDFNGMHPERMKELMNEGEEQAEQQVRQPQSPFGSKQSLSLEEPEEAGEGAEVEASTMPFDHPQANLHHKKLPLGGKVPGMNAVSGGGPVPTANGPSGGMNVRSKRGRSSFYGD